MIVLKREPSWAAELLLEAVAFVTSSNHGSPNVQIDDHIATQRLDYRTSIYHISSMPRRSSERPKPAASMYLLLALLDGENHGYALMRLVNEQSQGAVHMGPGTLYGTLNRLFADGLIVETTDDFDRSGNERRRYYRLTQDGDRVARAELDRLRTLVHRFRSIPEFGRAPA